MRITQLQRDCTRRRDDRRTVAQQHRSPGSTVKLRELPERTARYIIIGAICAAANNAVMILGDWAGGHYALMAVLSFGLVTPLGYLLHSNYTFREQISWRRFLRFASGVATGFPLSLLSMALLCSGLDLPVVLGAPITTITLFTWNYASAHWAILERWRLH
jgi:putative flippase GtrA